MSENKFCYLKGLVDCPSGIIQDCNMKRVLKCKLEIVQEEKQEGFCFLKGLVSCPPGRIQDCNMKHVETCMLEAD